MCFEREDNVTQTDKIMTNQITLSSDHCLHVQLDACSVSQARRLASRSAPSAHVWVCVSPRVLHQHGTMVHGAVCMCCIYVSSRRMLNC